MLYLVSFLDFIFSIFFLYRHIFYCIFLLITNSWNCLKDRFLLGILEALLFSPYSQFNPSTIENCKLIPKFSKCKLAPKLLKAAIKPFLIKRIQIDFSSIRNYTPEPWIIKIACWPQNFYKIRDCSIDYLKPLICILTRYRSSFPWDFVLLTSYFSSSYHFL